MSRLLFAFSGPVLWAASVHVDKYLVERHFKQADVGPLMVLTALFALFALPVIWWAHPEVAALDLPANCAVVLSGLLYMGAVSFLPSGAAVGGGFGRCAFLPDSDVRSPSRHPRCEPRTHRDTIQKLVRRGSSGFVHSGWANRPW